MNLNIFKKKTSPKDALRTSKREMAVATRGIEREIASLQMEEKKLVAEIKKTAKTGNEAATKILARQLVRLRQQITNLQGSRAQIRGMTTHTQALYANTSISTGMKGATIAMSAMNKIYIVLLLHLYCYHYESPDTNACSTCGVIFCSIFLFLRI
ncbi:vacuolar protein sorting-associated protein 2 homolog 2-like [Olea europaea var. sylvestris]|uniref:vacuolar protein sorting-associated protein 2 homolog 2-like n=1 Tax=Olea europaea var. sylvestris TaxID=158386 RepID=UPI000C1D50F9|nr:vacuolar protein sorting-associated protein 2 homolog 2-like [Olea europaea var. sylvestris]